MPYWLVVRLKILEVILRIRYLCASTQMRCINTHFLLRFNCDLPKRLKSSERRCVLIEENEKPNILGYLTYEHQSCLGKDSGSGPFGTRFWPDRF